MTRSRKWMLIAAIALGAAAVMVLAASIIALTVYRIPSVSMYPAIERGDRILAHDFSYGIPIPLFGGKLMASRVRRGDIVVFPRPDNPREDYIKRVIALGGETVEMRGGRVWVDGRRLEEPYFYRDPWALEVQAGRGGKPSKLPPVKIPAGHLFVLGDNRFNSVDSRHFGFIAEESVKSRGWLVYFSREPKKGILKGIRFHRLAKRLR
jgi:signal peptidase I